MKKQYVLLFAIALGFAPSACHKAAMDAPVGAGGGFGTDVTNGLPVGPCPGNDCSMVNYDTSCLQAPVCVKNVCRSKLKNSMQCSNGEVSGPYTCNALCDWQ